MTNIVLVFDHPQRQAGPREVTNAVALMRLLHDNDGQIVSYHPGARPAPATLSGRLGAMRSRSAIDDARTSVIEAYQMLVDRWQPGDSVFIFGAGRGGYCARELTRLLGTIGVIKHRSDHLLDYMLSTYVLPRTQRTSSEWHCVNRLAAQLAGYREVTVPVHYLGLWDAATPAGLRRSSAEPLDNVACGRHAIGIDGGPPPNLLATGTGARTEEVWFRGTHRDITGGPGACWPLTDIALDWVLDGAADAGIAVRTTHNAPTPNELDALAGAAHAVSLRRLPSDAVVHASVEIYLRAHPQYWRRFPARVQWADPDWLARSERLLPSPPRQAYGDGAGRRTVLSAAAS